MVLQHSSLLFLLPSSSSWHQYHFWWWWWSCCCYWWRSLWVICRDFCIAHYSLYVDLRGLRVMLIALFATIRMHNRVPHWLAVEPSAALSIDDDKEGEDRTWLQLRRSSSEGNLGQSHISSNACWKIKKKIMSDLIPKKVITAAAMVLLH